jgi:hypothetical protein
MSHWNTIHCQPGRLTDRDRELRRIQKVQSLRAQISAKRPANLVLH